MGFPPGYTVESVPGRARLPWRLPTFVFLLVLSVLLYRASRPCCQIAGHYQGRIGNEFSSDKYRLRVALSQNGSQLSGSCEVSNQRGGKVYVYTGRLQGQAQGDSFRVSSLLNDGRTLYLDGSPLQSKEDTELVGMSWTEAQGGASDRVSFRVSWMDARVSPEDLRVRKLRD